LENVEAPAKTRSPQSSRIESPQEILRRGTSNATKRELRDEVDWVMVPNLGGLNPKGDASSPSIGEY
jgi:hypothetical protein